jgi:hypothetical protein
VSHLSSLKIAVTNRGSREWPKFQSVNQEAPKLLVADCGNAGDNMFVIAGV